jgi:hypothetical protein
MSTKPRLLDLYCGAGGCSVGYARAGFEVVGVDHKPQRNYPFEFRQADALEYLAEHGRHFDAIHASPPCQRYSKATLCGPNRHEYPDLLPSTRDAIDALGLPWIIENVSGAPMKPPAVQLCGLMFGLKTLRHRWFESNMLLLAPSHPSHRGKVIGVGGMVSVVGHGGGPNSRTRERMKLSGDRDTKADWEKAMGIDWMTRDEIAQAIPPAYTEWVGKQLIRAVSSEAA